MVYTSQLPVYRPLRQLRRVYPQRHSHQLALQLYLCGCGCHTWNRRDEGQTAETIYCFWHDAIHCRIWYSDILSGRSWRIQPFGCDRWTGSSGDWYVEIQTSSIFLANNILAGGLFSYPAQASIQAISKHERESTNHQQNPTL